MTEKRRGGEGDIMTSVSTMVPLLISPWILVIYGIICSKVCCYTMLSYISYTNKPIHMIGSIYYNAFLSQAFWNVFKAHVSALNIIYFFIFLNLKHIIT